MGRDWNGKQSKIGCSGFNPRAHVGRDTQVKHLIHSDKVSIHAPTWGATSRPGEVHSRQQEFQSTRPRGARQVTPEMATACVSFNPRAHVGRDRCSMCRRSKNRRFNPRAHVGRDTSSSARRYIQTSFNPRAHVGRDVLRSMYDTMSSRSFNPRAHVGRDDTDSIDKTLKYVFQSTRPRGARPSARR